MQPAMQGSNNSAGCVLLVEDDPTTLMIQVSLLEDMNYRVLEARNGKEAIDIVAREANTIDVVILDRHMPDMYGTEVARSLKSNTSTAGLPIVMLTGSDSPEMFKEGIEAGVSYYLVKSFEDSPLEAILNLAMRDAWLLSRLRVEMETLQNCFQSMPHLQFTTETIVEVDELSLFAACFFPNPETIVSGLAELLNNALNLKTQPGNENKTITIDLHRNENETHIVIRDKGLGFDWSSYLDLSPFRIIKTLKCGIARASMVSFDSINYNEKTSEVTAISFNQSDEGQ